MAHLLSQLESLSVAKEVQVYAVNAIAREAGKTLEIQRETMAGLRDVIADLKLKNSRLHFQLQEEQKARVEAESALERLPK